MLKLCDESKTLLSRDEQGPDLFTIFYIPLSSDLNHLYFTLIRVPL